MQKSFYLLVVVALIILAASCNKKCDNLAPVVIVTSPAEKDSIQLPDSLQISGTLSDDVWLNNAVVMIHNQNEDTVFIEYPDAYGKKEISFAYTYHITTAGTYHLHVTAQDNDKKETEKEIVFTVLP